MKKSDDDGSIEAGMAMIPTTAFFLLVLQLVVAGSFQTIETIKLQSWLNKSTLYDIDGSEVSKSSLTTERDLFSNSGETLNRKVKEIELPGDAQMFLAQSRTKIPVISEFASKLTNSEALSVHSEALAFRE